jgi:hypothetical protein
VAKERAGGVHVREGVSANEKEKRKKGKKENKTNTCTSH